MIFRRILTTLCLLAVLFIPAVARAQNSGGQGLEISPPLIDLKADPGQTKTIQIYVRNLTQQTLVVSGEVNDFVAAGEDGQPKFLLEQGESSPYSIKDWIKTVPKVTLVPNERKTVNVVLDLPDNASPGGHYGVVRFTGTPPELEGTGVTLSASVGTLVLVNVSGNIVEQANLVEIYTTKYCKQEKESDPACPENPKKQSIFEYGPITIGVRLKNEGNVHFKPSGNIRVTNMFGRETASFKLNEQGSNVLPGSVRKYEQTMQKKLLFGRYRVHADVVYGSNNTILSVSKTFWVIPYKLIAVAVGAIALVIFLIRRYNRVIVKRASKKQGQNAGKRKQK
jgi:hypothetical protein